MRARIACGVIAVTLAATEVACGPARDEGTTADSAPVQVGPPVTPGGATAAALPAPPHPDTVGVTAGATSGTKAKPRVTTPSTPSKGKSADTLEYDRAIEFKPGPGKELPPVDEKKPQKP